MLASHVDPSLKDLVREWAAGNDLAYEYWMNELISPNNFITSIQILEERAQFEQLWDKLIHSVSDALSAKLRIWKRDIFDKIYPQSKS
jgi:hypothetical protein